MRDSRWRGRPARRAREQMFARYGTVCVYCGHDGAGEAGHLDAVALNPDQPIDPDLMRPAHGTNARCPICPRAKDGKLRACNQEYGTTPINSVFRPSINW